MNSRSTQPIEVESAEAQNLLWQANQITWSFTPQQKIVSWSEESQNIAHRSPSANRDASSTTGPQKIKPPERQSVALRGGAYGKRGFQALHEWEGVVESIGRDKFQSRIVPVTNGGAHGTKVETTDFSFNDLANESDRSLVVPGAIFYWTIGRSRNAAGTVTNLSLVRFRRLPAPTLTQNSEAEEKAVELLRCLGDDHGSSSSGT